MSMLVYHQGFATYSGVIYKDGNLVQLEMKSWEDYLKSKAISSSEVIWCESMGKTVKYTYQSYNNNGEETHWLEVHSDLTPEEETMFRLKFL